MVTQLATGIMSRYIVNIIRGSPKLYVPHMYICSLTDPLYNIIIRKGTSRSTLQLVNIPEVSPDQIGPDVDCANQY